MRKALVLGVLSVCVAIPRAQEISIARAAAQIDTAIPWITDAYTPKDRDDRSFPKSGADRAQLLDEAIKRAGSEKKLVFWYIPRIEGAQMYRPAIVDDYMRATAFTNPLLTNLISTRFVPLRMPVSRALFERTGIRPPPTKDDAGIRENADWVEPAIAILDASGKIVHRLDRIRTFNVDFFRQTLVDVLAKHAEQAPVPEAVVAACDAAVSDPNGAMKAARLAVWSGYDAGAEKIAASLIEKGPTPFLQAHGHFVSAVVHRLRRDAAGATAALDAAQKLAGDDVDLKGLITTERGLVALRSGDLTPARSLLADAAGMADNPRRAEAAYLVALARTLVQGSSGEDPSADRRFRKVVADFPDTPWGAQAALNVMTSRDTTPAGPVMHAFEDPFWPPGDAMGKPATNTAWARSPDQAGDATKRAVTFLLQHQSDNGGFLDARYAYWPDPRIIPNAWMAITAIALSGLADWREVDPARIDQALQRGERFLFTPKNLAPGQNEECYADAFRLLYLKRRLAGLGSDSTDAPKLRERMNVIAKALAEQQNEAGFFAHEYPNPFTTAACLVAMKQSQEAGAAVPAGVFELGTKGLKSVRGDGGAFAYGSRGKPGGPDALKDAMARMPICERALLFTGDGQDLAALEGALDNFFKYLPRLERIRTCDFHTDGELGGFFFWHGMYFTSEAVKALPPEKRAPHMKKLVEHVMSIGEIDGSFLDSHEMGKSYGTGMALMTLRNALEQKP
jgi:hypothetical protein